MNDRSMMVIAMTLVFALPAASAATDPVAPAAWQAGTQTPMTHGTVLAAGGMMGGGMSGGMSGGSGGGTMGGESGGMRNDSGGGTMGGSGGGMPGGAAAHGTQSIRLKDGSMLSTDEAGNMMMTDAHGRHMDMQDGETMETEDGRILMMKNNALWQRMPRGSLNPKSQ